MLTRTTSWRLAIGSCIRAIVSLQRAIRLESAGRFKIHLILLNDLLPETIVQTEVVFDYLVCRPFRSVLNELQCCRGASDSDRFSTHRQVGMRLHLTTSAQERSNPKRDSDTGNDPGLVCSVVVACSSSHSWCRAHSPDSDTVHTCVQRKHSDKRLRSVAVMNEYTGSHRNAESHPWPR